jgi:hypothetical protein
VPTVPGRHDRFALGIDLAADEARNLLQDAIADGHRGIAAVPP